MSDIKVIANRSDIVDIADAIRGKTGKTEPMTLDQMAAEIAGIQAGVGLTYDMGEFVLDSDKVNIYTDVGILHALGEVPDFVLIWTDDFSKAQQDNLPQYTKNISLGYAWFNGLFGMTQRLTSTASTDYGIFIPFACGYSDYRVNAATPTSTSYCLRESLLPTADRFSLPQLASAGNQAWMAGVTYKYFVAKAWWNVGGVTNAE